MNRTSIEWTDFTWNPIRARNNRSRRIGTFCTRISPGCKNCYASTINRRFGTGDEYEVPNLAHTEFFLKDRMLAEPVARKKPARIFVGDMFDLFHEQIPIAFITEVLRVAHETPRHTFQFLTKRAERMRVLVNRTQEHWGVTFGSHMHFGVSVEDQHRADERVPELLRTLAAVIFLSVEPMLQAIDLVRAHRQLTPYCLAPGVNWVICGGESGPGARPFNLAWAEVLLKQCRAANVPFFMKQIGSNPWWMSKGEPEVSNRYRTNDRKGGDPAEWPEALRVREFPR